MGAETEEYKMLAYPGVRLVLGGREVKVTFVKLACIQAKVFSTLPILMLRGSLSVVLYLSTFPGWC